MGIELKIPYILQESLDDIYHHQSNIAIAIAIDNDQLHYLYNEYAIHTASHNNRQKFLTTGMSIHHPSPRPLPPTYGSRISDNIHPVPASYCSCTTVGTTRYLGR